MNKFNMTVKAFTLTLFLALPIVSAMALDTSISQPVAEVLEKSALSIIGEDQYNYSQNLDPTFYG